VKEPTEASQPNRLIKVTTAEGEREIDIYSPEGFAVVANLWTRSNWQQKLSYEVTWLGISIIQLPEDILMVQELIWKNRPDVIEVAESAADGERNEDLPGRPANDVEQAVTLVQAGDNIHE